MVDARNPALEEQIFDDPEDPAAYLVYADWLQAAGDPRGRLIAIQAARAADPRLGPLATEEAAILAEHREALRGPRLDVDGVTIEWHCGFWRCLSFDWLGAAARPARDEHVARFIAEPSARFLRQLAASGRLTPGVLGALAPLGRTLRALDLSLGSGAEDEHLRVLRPLAELRRLVLSSCEAISPLGMEVLASLRHLEWLDLRGCPLSDDGVRHLAGLPLVHTIFDNVLPAFTVAGMRTLAAAPLRELHLDAAALDDRCIEPLLGHPALADLELPGARITAPGARVLGSLPRLRRLQILESTLDDLGAAALAPLAGQLQSLHLGGATSLTDAACETLSAFERLAFLDIGSTQIGGAGVRMLSQLRDLEQLDLHFLNLVDDDLLALAPHAKLRALRLYMCRRITDRAIDAIERLSLLDHLDLGGTQITREAIDRLAGMPRLHTIGLEACDPRAIAHARTFEHWDVIDYGPATLYERSLA